MVGGISEKVLQLFKRSLLGWAIVACIFTTYIYYPSLATSFNSDDYVIANEVARETNVWHFFLQPSQNVFYRPVQDLVIWFIGADPLYLRIFALVIHLLNVWLIMKVAKVLFDEYAGLKDRPYVIAGFSGLLFAILPRIDEAVVWIAAINNLVVATAFLGATLAVLKYIRTRQRVWIIILAGMMLLGFLSKENIVVFPGVAFILVWFLSMRRSDDKKRGVVSGFREVAFSPLVVVPSIEVITYMILRFMLFKGIGGYGLGASIGESRAHVFLRIAANVIRYPLICGLSPFNILMSIYKMPSFYFIVAALIGISIIIPLFVRQRDKNIGWNKNILVLLLLLFGITMLPTVHLSPSLLTNSGGRCFYLPGIWFSLAVGAVFFMAFSFRMRLFVSMLILGTYVYIGRYTCELIYKGGKVTDRLISDYKQYCETHPSSKPSLLMTESSLGGLGFEGYGMKEAIVFNGYAIPYPGPVILGIYEASECDSIIVQRVSDSVLHIKDLASLSYIGAWDDPTAMKQIVGISLPSRNEAYLTLRDSCFSDPQRPMLVVCHNRLIPLHDSYQ